MSDITEQKLAEDALRASEEKYRNLIENINEVTYALDTTGNITFISPVVEHMLGYKATEIEGHSFGEFAHPDDLEVLARHLEQMLGGIETSIEFRVITRDDYILHVRASSKLIRDDEAAVVGISGILSDITKQYKAEKALQKAMDEVKLLSVTDVLTGGFNRGYLNENLPRELARSKRYCQPMALIMCDLDHFKQINDNYGHQIGDKVLQKFVRDVKQVIRHNIDWVVRYGGEEFLITLPKTDLRGAMSLAERLRRDFSAKAVRLDDGRSLMITASFGVVCYDPEMVEGEVSQDRLINQADIYLYEAKKLGRNRVNGDYFHSVSEACDQSSNG
ncbi:MAG: Phytochrome-like protein cph2 [Deltaproteobacteria bacterium ADurb.Bin510]|nr:MAG: Phytochrome-like protein cph2 [Deltaproteobacteria bacterium ADurb.Bin510]